MSLFVDPMTGWLGGLLGDSLLGLVRRSPDEDMLQTATNRAVEVVLAQVEESSRESLRQGLAQCFARPPVVELDGSVPVRQAVQQAVAAQVAILRTMVANERGGRAFFVSISVREDWLAEQVAEALLTALRQTVAASGIVELVRALEDEHIRASLDEIRTLMQRVIELLPDPARNTAAHQTAPAASADTERRSGTGHETADRSAWAEREQARLRRIFEGGGWIETLRSLYPSYRLLDFAGKTFPIWVSPAASASEQKDLDAALEPDLDQSRVSFPDAYATWYNQDPELRVEYRELQQRAQDKTSHNGSTYALHALDPHSRKIIARLGWYFDSLVTSERLDAELMRALEGDPDRPADLDALPRRRFEHQQTQDDPVRDGAFRSAALSISTTVVVADPTGGYKVLLTQRSDEVATHPRFYHVAPSGIFQPLDTEWREPLDEFSVWQSLAREYAEELFGYKNLEWGYMEDGTKVTAHNLDMNPRIGSLKSAVADPLRDVHLCYCGLSVNLCTLRPEIHTVLFIRDASWWEHEIGEAEKDGHPLCFNWEYRKNDRRFLKLDGQFRPVDTRGILNPGALVPNGAAALALATGLIQSLE